MKRILLLTTLSFLIATNLKAQSVNNTTSEGRLNQLTSKDFIGTWSYESNGVTLKLNFNANNAMSIVLVTDIQGITDAETTISGFRWTYQSHKINVSTTTSISTNTEIEFDYSSLTPEQRSILQAAVEKTKIGLNKMAKEKATSFAHQYEVLDWNSSKTVTKMLLLE